MILAHANAVDHVATSAALVLGAAVYLSAWSHKANRSLPRAAAFCLGLITMQIALSPPAETAADATFTGHMVQHLALYALAPPLLVLGRPILTISRRIPAALHRWSRALGGSAMRAPVVATVASITVLYGLHLTPLYDAALTHEVVHAITHLCLIGAGLLAWQTALRPGIVDGPLRFLVAITASVPVAVLGVVLTTASAPLSTHYEERLGFDQALVDQHAGGALMWVGSMLAGAALVVATTWRWASHEHAIAERSETIRSQSGAPKEAR